MIGIDEEKRQELIKKIENDDPETLGKIVDLILMQEGAPIISAIKCTDKTLRRDK